MHVMYLVGVALQADALCAFSPVMQAAAGQPVEPTAAELEELCSEFGTSTACSTEGVAASGMARGRRGAQQHGGGTHGGRSRTVRLPPLTEPQPTLLAELQAIAAGLPVGGGAVQ